jgi:class 3 adenylate cyclase/predicted ATPase
MECTSCRAKIPEGKRFCMECGARVATLCPSCGSINPPNMNFCGDCGANLRGTVRSPVHRESAPDSPATSAERRQLTVMFCDLVGSTDLASRLDPEDLREVIGSYHQCVAEIATRYDGFVAKYMGDGVLVYFGYPRTHEDEAERAVQASLDLLSAVDRLRPFADVTLQIRIGIATGSVIVGDLIGSGAAQEQAVVGAAPNLAARLQALADPGTVVIAAGTRQLVGGLFDCVDLGTIALKGFAEPVPWWRVVGASRVAGRFEALRGQSLSPLTGRERELSQLAAAWRAAREGNGQFVMMSGEPGIGKSRLLQALLGHASADPHTALRYFCSRHRQSSPLYPFIEQLERAAGFKPDDTAEEKLTKLEMLLAEGDMQLEAAAPLLAALLSIPVSGRHGPLAMSAQRQKDLTFQVLLHHHAGIAARQPTLMVFEDAHWMDPSSVELLRLVLERVRSWRVLLLTTFRPDFKFPWPDAIGTLLQLGRLDHNESLKLIRQLAGKPLPSPLLDQIVFRADGVPLYLEELTRTVLEGDLLRNEGSRWALAGPLPALAVPATLQDSLTARLDRLGSVKEVAQIAAIIGREFSYDLLAAVADRGPEQLQGELEQLVKAGLILRRAAAPVTYGFKHALIQDAAYGILLRDRRRQLHAKVATALEEQFPHIGELEPETLAHHSAAAGMIGKAIGYWQRAGERAAKRSANLEAIDHLRQALGLLSTLPQAAERDERELGILLTLGPCLMATKGWDSLEVRSAYERARQLARALGRSAELFPSLWGLWLVAHAGGDAPTARALQSELQTLAEGQDDPTLMLQAHHAGWSTFCSDGEFSVARRHVEQGVSLYRPELHRQQALTYGGHDPCVCALSLAALSHFITGFPETARRHSNDAVSLAREIGHAPTLAHALWYRAELCQIRGEVDEAAELSATVLELARKNGMAQYAAWAMMVQGWAETARGSDRLGLGLVREGWSALGASGTKYHLPHRVALLAQTQAAAGEMEAALATIQEATAAVDETGERWFEAEVYRWRAVLLLARSDWKEAEDCLQRAVQVSAQQGARLWELRAATTLARHISDTGRSREAHDLLAPILAGFEERLDTADLNEARALLELSQERGSHTGGGVLLGK